MPVFWVLAVLALVAVLLLRTRISLLLSVQKLSVKEQDVALTLRAGFLHVAILPRKEEPEKPPQKKKKRKRPPKETKKEKEVPARRVTFSQIVFALRTVPPLIRKALRRILRGTRIDPLELYISIGGEEDPAQAAQECEYALAAVWAFMPRLERVLAIPEPYIDVAADFDAAETSIEGEIGVSIRMGTAAAAVIPLIAGLIHIWNTMTKENKKRAARRERSAA